MTERPKSNLPLPLDMDRRLRAQDWADLRKRLFDMTRRWKRFRFRAEDLVDTVIVDCCDPRAKPWNPNEEPDLVRHALRVLGNRLSAERRKDLVRSHPHSVAVVQELTPPPATPSELLDRAEREAREERVFELARARLSNEIDTQVLALLLDGIDKPTEQAARLAIPIEDIRRARERVKYAVRAANDDEASLWKNATDPLKTS